MLESNGVDGAASDFNWRQSCASGKRVAKFGHSLVVIRYVGNSLRV